MDTSLFLLQRGTKLRLTSADQLSPFRLAEGNPTRLALSPQLIDLFCAAGSVDSVLHRMITDQLAAYAVCKNKSNLAARYAAVALRMWNGKNKVIAW